ncbi:glycosyltransferase family 4 protein [Candidatus Fermentibacteria bacterium]|nr:glycosyltransferase family 4 protein [Candidatus Fermentibacteria bacterium]
MVRGLGKARGRHDVFLIRPEGGAGRRTSYLTAVTRLTRLLSSRKYDLVHAQYAHAGIVCALAARLPLVLHIHGEFGYRDYEPRVPRGLGERLLYFKDSLLARIASRLADATIVVNPHDLRHVRGRVRKCIPIGPDEGLFVPLDRAAACSELGWGKDSLKVLFAGESTERLEKGYPLFRSILDRLGALGVDVEEVIFRGYRHEEVPVLLNAVDLVILTSRTEASPTIVKEANFCNLPVVSTPVGDVEDQLDGISPGGVFPPDPDILAEAAADILRGRNRSNGREMALEKWSLRTTVSRLLETYSEVLANKRGGSA